MDTGTYKAEICRTFLRKHDRVLTLGFLLIHFYITPGYGYN
jgi:hypothetical protein